MGLTKSEQVTLVVAILAIVAGFSLQALRQRTAGAGVWVESGEAWQPIPLTPPSPGGSSVSGSPPPGSSPAALTGLAPSGGAPQTSAVSAPTPDKGVPRPLIDLNLATQPELELLPGIGPAKAQAILDYRRRSNGFRSLGQLLEVQGIGPKTLERLEPFLTLGAASDPSITSISSGLKTGVPHSGPGIRPTPSPGAKVNLNTASAAELELLPGIGPVMAGRIIDHRNRRPFASVEELDSIQGIGTVTMSRLRDRVTVD